MAFDMGWNFRNTLGYVTDGAEGVFATHSQAYPTTYTNGNGDSVNAGWDLTTAASLDRVDTNDPRIAGCVFQGTSQAYNFQIDLSSGSNPGAGDYTVDVAGGDPGNGNGTDFIIKDDTTAFIDTGGRLNTAANHFRDATVTDVTATTTWTGTTVARTFASTTCNVLINNAGGAFAMLAHFRLTLQAAGGAQAIFTQDHIGRGIGRGIFAGR